MGAITIDLRDLQKITNRLFDHIIKTRGTTSVELRSDSYWQVPIDRQFDMSSGPMELDVGSLHDDWEFVSAFLAESEEPTVFSFTELAPLLNYLGATVEEFPAESR